MKISIARVYHGGGRRWFTLTAACKAESIARIKDKRAEQGYCHSEDEWPYRLIQRYARMLERWHRRMTP